jgi:hypothetical protein
MRLRFFFTSFFLIFLLILPAFAQPGIPTLKPRFVPRRNLGLVFAKLKAGKTLNIAYLGGTAAPDKNSYRAFLNNWFHTNYPNTKINELNSIIAGTGSPYAAIRVRRDVVEQKPDLVFLEFTSSDIGFKEDDIKKSVEGIIRQLLAVSQPPEIVMVYTADSQNSEVKKWHDDVANYYHLPTLNYSDEASVNNFFGPQLKESSSPLVRILPGYLLSDEMTYGELKPFAELGRSVMWKTEPTNDKNLPSILLAADKPASEITTNFEGTVVGLSFRMGPDCGMIECLIDDKPAPLPLKQIDLYSAEPRLGTSLIAGGLPPGEHKLTIKIIAEKNPKSSGMWVRLGAFLIGGARPEKL